MDKVHTKATKAEGSSAGRTPKAVLGPLSMRDLVVVLGGVAVLVGSLVPIPWTEQVSVNMWIFPGLPFHLFVSLLLPLLVAGGFLWRRATMRTRVRAGSLSLDQAGSVVSLFAAAYFFNSYVASMSPAYLIGFIGSLAMISGTTLACYIPAFRRDFAHGGGSMLASDVAPMPAADQADASAPAAAKSDDDDSFGASSAAPAAGQSANRPAVPMTGKNDAPRATSPAATPAAGTETGKAAPAASTSATSASAAVPGATAGSSAPVAGAAAGSAVASDPAAAKDGSAAAAAPSTSSSSVKGKEPADIASPAAGKTAAEADADETGVPAKDASANRAPSSPSAANAPSSTAPATDETTGAQATGNEEKDANTAAAATDKPREATRAGGSADADQARGSGQEPATGRDTTKDSGMKPGDVKPGDAEKSGTDAKDVALASASAPNAAETRTATPSPETGTGPRAAATVAEKIADTDTEKDSATEGSAAATVTAAARAETNPEAQAPVTQDPEPAPGTRKEPEAVSLAPDIPADHATSAVPRVSGDIKATAALSRTEIDAHRAAAERAKAEAKAEAESSFGARADVAAAEPEPASFWFALNHSRPVFHPANGTKLATLDPGQWILCLEDRGNEYLLSMADGRPAVLRDLDDLQFPDK